jgi:hypothetical protein
LDLRRTLLLGAGYGSLVFAPVLHFVTMRWARVLPATTIPALIYKTAVDMTTSFPFNLAVMLSVQSVARQRETPLIQCFHPENVRMHFEAVRDNLWAALVAGWKFWPAMSCAMYGIIPLHYRLLWLNFGSLFWNSFMIYRFEETGEEAADNI